MKIFRFLALAFLILASSTSLLAEESDQTGTLIVTYKTVGKGERLDRIRFWLKEDNKKHRFFPVEKGFLDDPEKKSRMVVVDDLSPGVYTLQFLIPNTDGFFAAVPDKTITIKEGEVLKIDQKIKQSSLRKDKDSVEVLGMESSHAGIAVKSKPQEVGASEKAVQSGGEGKLILSYEFVTEEEFNEPVSLRLTRQDGTASMHPQSGIDTDVPLSRGGMLMLPHVAEGEYRMEMMVQGPEGPAVLDTGKLTIEAGKTKSMHKMLPLPTGFDTKPGNNIGEEELKSQFS